VVVQLLMDYNEIYLDYAGTMSFEDLRPFTRQELEKYPTSAPHQTGFGNAKRIWLGRGASAC
ncbi:10292_t:CDS:1, partial [Paraglomus occultum]